MTDFMSTYRGVYTNVKAVVAAFNQEKALVGAFSVIVQICRLIVSSSTSELPTPIHRLHCKISIFEQRQS